jgi:hypothetical protein
MFVGMFWVCPVSGRPHAQATFGRDELLRIGAASEISVSAFGASRSRYRIRLLSRAPVPLWRMATPGSRRSGTLGLAAAKRYPHQPGPQLTNWRELSAQIIGGSMATVEQRQKERDDFLVALYELADGDTSQWPTAGSIAEMGHIPSDRIVAIARAVVSAGWSELVTVGNSGPASTHYRLTRPGIQHAEEIITQRERSGEPQYSGIVVLTDTELHRKLEPIVATLRLEIENDQHIEPETRADLLADLDSAHDQLRASHPNRGVIRASLDRIKRSWPAIAGIASLAADVLAIIHGL